MKLFLPNSQKKDLSKEIVLVTGAASGIGRLMSLRCVALHAHLLSTSDAMPLSWYRFAEEGACVVLWDINKAGNKAVQEEIKSKGQRAHAYTCDCSKREDIYRVAETVR